MVNFMENRLLLKCSIAGHPLANRQVPLKIKIEYFSILKSICEQVEKSKYIYERLHEYKSLFNIDDLIELETSIKDLILTNTSIKYNIPNIDTIFLVDLHKILVYSQKVIKGIEIFKQYTTETIFKTLCRINDNLLHGNSLMWRDKWVRKEVTEMKRNLSFLEKNEIRIIATSNMSAGKSTLLNCFIGDSILPSSQERCTSNLTFIYEKMSDNHRISVYDEKLRVDLPDKSVTDIDWKRSVSIYSELTTPYSRKLRLCLIDTPGANSSTETAHGKITKNAIKTEHYDKLLYIVSRPGTDEEIEYLKWIFYNADRDKVIFVLNKIDEYRNNEDNVKESIARLNTDLKNIGFINPTICPTSSYFGLLLKKSKRFQALDDNEKDDLEYLIKKFSRDDNDMSIYYPKGLRYYGRDSIKIMESKCGVYELERMVLGGQKA